MTKQELLAICKKRNISRVQLKEKVGDRSFQNINRTKDHQHVPDDVEVKFLNYAEPKNKYKRICNKLHNIFISIYPELSDDDRDRVYKLLSEI